MQFWIDVDDVRVPVQIVKRGKKVFWRIAPYFLHEVTEKQKAVRNTLARASSSQFGKSLHDVTHAVAEAFENWESSNSTQSETAVELALKEMFGAQEVDAINTYYLNKDHQSAIARYQRRKERQQNNEIIFTPNIKENLLKIENKKPIKENAREKMQRQV